MKKIERKKLGIVISRLRDTKDIRQEALAKALKIPRPSVSQIEKGERDLSFTEFRKLLEVFQVSYDEFTELLREGQVKKPIKRKNKKIKFDLEKFKQLFLYILEKCGNKPNVGETVLYKLLYFCDFDYFEIYEKALTGMTYKRLQYGPVPAQQLFNPLIKEMIDKGLIERIIRPYIGETVQTKYMSFVKADLSDFNNQERDVIDKVINRLSDLSARQIEDHAHGDHPWKSHKDDEEIEYSSVFQRTGEFAQRDYEMEFLEASGEDAFGDLNPLTEEEYEYYTSLKE